MITSKYWPSLEWRFCLPEQQGMNPDMLDKAYAYLTKEFPALCQITIIRHGYIVYDKENLKARESLASRIYRRQLAVRGARNGCPKETFLDNDRNRWNIRSASKSVTSIVIGMALVDELISDLDQCAANILPEYFAGTAEPAKKQITLRHLLTMSSGLSSVERGAAAFQMLASKNWTRYIADLPMVSNPGERFNYNSANAHLLSAVISKLSGKSMLEYANERLFGPLGIEEVVWGAGPEGVTFGGGNLFLSSQELAKIGLLYLYLGKWEREQLVSQRYVSESLLPRQAYIPGWDYGYSWYLHTETDEERQRQWATFSAAGAGGQKLLVVPQLDLILAAVAKTDFVGEKGIFLNKAISKYLLPAVKEI